MASQLQPPAPVQVPGTESPGEAWTRWGLPTGLVVVAALCWALAGRNQDAPLAKRTPDPFVGLTPEYLRTSASVAFSLAEGDRSLEHQLEIIRHLPGYTEITLLLPRSNEALIREELAGLPFADRVRLEAYDAKRTRGTDFYVLFPEKEHLAEVSTSAATEVAQFGSLWAQDLFEVGVNRTGQTTLLQPVVHKWFCANNAPAEADSDTVGVQRDNAYVAGLTSQTCETRVVPLAFKGGNVLNDCFRGERIVFCGGDVLRTTKVVGRAMLDVELSSEEIEHMIADEFRVDRVVVLGRDQVQPRMLYHLDQAMVLLPDGVVGVERIIDSGEDEAQWSEEVQAVDDFLRDVRTALSDLGYDVFDIGVTVANVRSCQHYANVIPFTNSRQEGTAVLMPVFQSADTAIDAELVERNAEAFRAHGCTVTLVPTRLDELRGGIHCVINVLR